MQRNDIPTKVDGLFFDEVGGKTLVLNPRSGRGVTLLGPQAVMVLDSVNGLRTIEEIARLVNAGVDDLLVVFEKLANKEIVSVSGYKPIAKTTHDLTVGGLG